MSGDQLYLRRGGTDGPTVLLLHGLGATGEVWNGLTGLLGDRRWVAPDLPGHGRSASLPGYTFTAVADVLAPLVDPAGTVVLGHSFGGAVGLLLAARPGVRAVIGLGIKVAWTPDELARAAGLAARPAQVFDSRERAVTRHLRTAGLDGLVDPADERAVGPGVRATDGGWQVAFDPRAFGVGEPAVAGWIADVRATGRPVAVVLARGGHDAMVSAADLADLGADDVVELPGLGHNAHVECPTALVPLLGF